MYQIASVVDLFYFARTLVIVRNEAHDWRYSVRDDCGPYFIDIAYDDVSVIFNSFSLSLLYSKVSIPVSLTVWIHSQYGVK